jgi:hypothetical protein
MHTEYMKPLLGKPPSASPSHTAPADSADAAHDSPAVIADLATDKQDRTDAVSFHVVAPQNANVPRLQAPSKTSRAAAGHWLKHPSIAAGEPVPTECIYGEFPEGWANRPRSHSCFALLDRIKAILGRYKGISCLLFSFPIFGTHPIAVV